MRKKLFLLLILFGTFFNLAVVHVTGEGVTQGRFSVSPIYPDNQQGGESGYFNLLVNPGQQETISFVVKSYSEEEIKINASVNHATTSDAGAIDYNKGKNKLNKKVPFRLEDFSEISESDILLPPFGEKKIDVKIDVPKEKFKGQVLGGIYVSETGKLTEEEQKKTVVNRFAYSIPISLYEDTAEITPEIALNDISAVSQNGRPYIIATFNNEEARLINKFEIKGEIIDKKNNETVYTRQESSLQIAPNSIFNFNFDLQNSEVVSGTYIAKFNIIADGQKFDFKKEFTITREQAKEINEKNAFKVPEKKNYTIPIIVLILFLLLLIFIGYKKDLFDKLLKKDRKNSKKKKTKQEKNKTSNSKKKKTKQEKNKTSNSRKKTTK